MRTGCPGRPMTDLERESVRSGKLNFFDGGSWLLIERGTEAPYPREMDRANVTRSTPRQLGPSS